MANARNEYVKRRWAALIEEFGGCCHICGWRFFLEFAHRQPTRCRGESRGKSRRLTDILRHRAKYMLLCMDCHDRWDGRKYRLRIR